ncbi:MAG: hypothetical protein H0U82_08790 [Actinobacteria bacterium]|nr:hypothetical protein [Actinomycetota bacterium]
MRARLPLLLASAALVVALLGSTPLGEAAGRIVLPRGSVGTAQLQAGAVTAAKVKNRSLLARDFKPGQLPRGEPGPPGTIEGVAAGGDLAGAYPSPELAPGAVSGVEVSDGSLRLADTAVLSGQVRVNPPQVAAHACVSLSGAVAGVKPYDRTLVLPTQNLSAGLFVTQIFNTNAAGRILFRVCNATAKALDPPLGGWAYVVWRQ